MGPVGLWKITNHKYVPVGAVKSAFKSRENNGLPVSVNTPRRVFVVSNGFLEKTSREEDPTTDS